MKIFLISLTIISSLLMVGVILLQQGKGADLGSAFGSGARGGLFGVSGRANFLTRTTSALVTVFLLSSLALSVFLGRQNERDSILQDLQDGATDKITGDESTDGAEKERGAKGLESLEYVEQKAADDKIPD